MASCFCWAVNRRLVLVGLVIDGQSEGHGVTPIDLSTKPGQLQIVSESIPALADQLDQVVEAEL